MAIDKAVDSAELDAGLKVIANAIRKRTGTTAELDWYQPMADAIENIPASGVQLPTIAEDVLGTASDLAEGKQLIGMDGEVVTGKVTRYTNDDTHTFIGTEVKQGVNNRVGIWRITDKAEMMDAGTSYGLYAEGSNFGDAGPGDVRAGKTFTSKEGLKIPGAWEPPVEKDVNFWDYDGTLLYSYTLEETQALSVLPSAPTPKKDFLIFDEWNWTLEQIKSLNLPVDVGATYKTADDRTYLVVEVADPKRMEVTLHYAQWCSYFEVDWGDGSPKETTEVGSNRNKTLTHIYSELGIYTITINANGTWNAGLNSQTAPLIGMGQNDALSGAFLREAYTGKGIRFLSNAFNYAICLETVMLSKLATFNIEWVSVFNNCHWLKAVIFPSHFPGSNGYYMKDCHSLTVLSLPYNATKFSDCDNAGIKRFTASPNLTSFSLGNTTVKEVFLSEGVETVGDSGLYGSRPLHELILPASLLKISQQGLRCFSLSRMRFKSHTPPIVTNANAFLNLPTYCVVEVPAESLTAYQEATNYGTIAAQMVGV